METMGYLFCGRARDAFDAFEALPWDGTFGMRYVAQLDNGDGFGAFDGEPSGLTEFGTVKMAQAFFHPWIAAPKRGVGTGREVFSMVGPEMAENFRQLYEYGELQSIHSAVVLDDSFVLFESDGAIGAGFATARVVRFSDARTERGVMA